MFMKADAFDRFIGLRHLRPDSRRAGSTASFFSVLLEMRPRSPEQAGLDLRRDLGVLALGIELLQLYSPGVRALPLE
jgi:hypothetical protein